MKARNREKVTTLSEIWKTLEENGYNPVITGVFSWRKQRMDADKKDLKFNNTLNTLVWHRNPNFVLENTVLIN